jgi:hypothetical protein
MKRAFDLLAGRLREFQQRVVTYMRDTLVLKVIRLSLRVSPNLCRRIRCGVAADDLDERGLLFSE